MPTWLAGLSEAFQAVWLPAVLLSGVATGILLAGGSRRRKRTPAEQTPASREPVFPTFASGQVDLAAELRSTAEAHAAGAVARRIRLQIALEPDLMVRADPLAVRAIVGDLLRNAIDHSEGGHILLGAARHGGRVRITVGDDGIPVDSAEQAADLRDAERLVALQGGTLDISVHPQTGTLITVRLPDKAATPEPDKASTSMIRRTQAEQRAPAAIRVE